MVPRLIYEYIDKECGPTSDSIFNRTGADFYFDGTDDVALFVHYAETTYDCNATLHGTRWFMIDSTNESVPANCYKYIRGLYTSHNYTGPLEMPGLTELSSLGIRGTYSGAYRDNGLLLPTNITSIDLPDLVNISTGITIDNAASITSLNLPRLRHLDRILFLNFTGGPAINLTFPSLADVKGIEIYGEIDT